MSDIFFISDFFADEINGGAERCNEAFIQLLGEDFNVSKVLSRNVDLDFIQENKNAFFIVANFFHLRKNVKKYIADNVRYIIYEHDHKYLANNNPLKFKNFVAPQSSVINKNFFQNAEYVICQSKLHSEIVYKNMLTDNIINAGANFWSKEDLAFIESKIGETKEHKYASMANTNKNKGTLKSVDYCKKKGYELSLIPELDFKNFISALSKVENFVFFPQWVESYSRVAIEAKILGCKIITNRFLGVASEDYFSLNGVELLNKIKENNDTLLKKMKRIINEEPIEANVKLPEIPKITISCSVYNGDKYIEHFLEDITNQSVFKHCELIIVNANSPGDEESVIKQYVNQYENIKYKRLDYRASTTEVINMVIDEMATGEYITIGNIDDRRRKDCLEIQARYLMFNDDISLVYGDCFQTEKENETFNNNSSRNFKYEHSLKDFSKENMIKCLPGPMPMWRLNVHKDVGLFSEKYHFANDWDMWLRMVDAGLKFKKIDKSVGLYYFNPDGMSTSKDNFSSKIKEEAELFFRYEHIFGQKNFNMFKDYFSQGIRNE
tara:strand:- start:12110 stop:13765 length:1656 start_codon:yes stop_codon:yes gene_type:complete